MNELQKRALSLGLPATATLEDVERREREVSNLTVRASFVPKTLNEETRTIDVVFATETPVRMFTWEDGAVDEILSMDPGHVRLGRLNQGAPVLDNHNRWEGTGAVLGVVENARIENGVGVATLRFSTREDVNGTWNDVKTGILRGISVGYQVHKYEIVKEDGKRAQYRATDWEPVEVSFAPVQADPNSSVRKLEKITIDNSKTHIPMNELEKRALAAGLAQTATLAEVETAERAIAAKKENDIEQARKAAIEAERKRSKEITDAVRVAGLETLVAERLIAEGHDINKSRELIFTELAKTNPEVNGGNRGANVTVGKEQVEKTRSAMEEAILVRVAPDTKVVNGGNEFRGMSLMDMARQCVEAAGISTRGLSRKEVASLALGLGDRARMHSSSDFPIILGNTVNKTLRAAYEQQNRTFQPWTRKANIADFKQVTRAAISGLVGSFDQIPEGGEYKQATLTDGKEVYQLAKYGKKIAFTWETLIDDDLDAFSRVPAAIAAQAANKQSDIIYKILLTNPNMGDAKALFHADHGNLGSAAAINSTSMGLMRAAFRKQTDPNGTLINVAPKYLIVGPDKETEAQMLLNAAIVATKTSDTNVFRGFAELIVEGRVTGNKWFLSAAPGVVDTVEYAFLDGEAELFTERQTNFDNDSLEIKARMVFAAKAIDHRGLAYNAGA